MVGSTRAYGSGGLPWPDLAVVSARGAQYSKISKSHLPLMDLTLGLMPNKHCQDDLQHWCGQNGKLPLTTAGKQVLVAIKASDKPLELESLGQESELSIQVGLFKVIR